MFYKECRNNDLLKDLKSQKKILKRERIKRSLSLLLFFMSKNIHLFRIKTYFKLYLKIEFYKLSKITHINKV